MFPTASSRSFDASAPSPWDRSPFAGGTQLTEPSGDKTTYSFDGDGLRRSVATTNQSQDPPTLDVTTMVWDGSDYLLLNEPTGNRVVLTLDSEIVACGSKDLLTDPLGSLVKEISAGASLGSLVELYPYGTRASAMTKISIPFLYIAAYGYYNDTPDRDYVRARELMKKLGRWMQADPLWPSRRPYRYASASPASLTDPTGLQTYSECIREAMNNLLTTREACILCQQKVNRKRLDQAQRICAHLPNTRWGPPPPGIIPKPGGGHYNDPPPIVDWLIGVCSGFLPPGADVMVGMPGGAKNALCIKALTDLDRLWKKFCSEDEDSPGRGGWPDTPPEYWDNYCTYLEYAINEWKAFCAR